MTGVDWKTAILLELYTRARLGDRANMTWNNVKFVECVIDFVPQKSKKTNKRVVIPMHPALKLHLDKLAANGKDKTHLCPSLAGKESGGTYGLSKGFSRIMAKAKVDAQMIQGKGKRKFSNLSFHSFRHTCNSMMANSGLDQETRMRLTGHSSLDVNTGYTHLDLPKLQQAVSALPSISASEPIRLEETNGNPEIAVAEEDWQEAS